MPHKSRSGDVINSRYEMPFQVNRHKFSKNKEKNNLTFLIGCIDIVLFGDWSMFKNQVQLFNKVLLVPLTKTQEFKIFCVFM